MNVLVDTGPLVAYLDRREEAHEWVSSQMAHIRSPLLTCEAVLTEACFLLQRSFPDGVRRLESWLSRDLLRVSFDLADHGVRVFRLMETYANLPMSLADACLVVMVEKGIGNRIFTLDKHFRIYRHSGRRIVPVLMPD